MNDRPSTAGRPRPALRLIVLALAAACGCSFVVDFEHEGKPCNSELKCLDGFECYHADAGIPVCLSPENANGWTLATKDAN